MPSSKNTADCLLGPRLDSGELLNLCHEKLAVLVRLAGELHDVCSHDDVGKGQVVANKCHRNFLLRKAVIPNLDQFNPWAINTLLDLLVCVGSVHEETEFAKIVIIELHQLVDLEAELGVRLSWIEFLSILAFVCLGNPSEKRLGLTDLLTILEVDHRSAAKHELSLLLHLSKLREGKFRIREWHITVPEGHSQAMRSPIQLEVDHLERRHVLTDRACIRAATSSSHIYQSF